MMFNVSRYIILIHKLRYSIKNLSVKRLSKRCPFTHCIVKRFSDKKLFNSNLTFDYVLN